MNRARQKSESSNEKKTKSKRGSELKIMTPNQLLTRLPILLAQKKARNNSEKLNNEIRQIIHSLYSSKNMSKTVYNHFMIIIRSKKKQNNIFSKFVYILYMGKYKI